MENIQKANAIYFVWYNLTGLNNADEDQWKQ